MYDPIAHHLHAQTQIHLNSKKARTWNASGQQPPISRPPARQVGGQREPPKRRAMTHCPRNPRGNHRVRVSQSVGQSRTLRGAKFFAYAAFSLAAKISKILNFWFKIHSFVQFPPSDKILGNDNFNTSPICYPNGVFAAEAVFVPWVGHGQFFLSSDESDVWQCEPPVSIGTTTNSDQVLISATPTKCNYGVQMPQIATSTH